MIEVEFESGKIYVTFLPSLKNSEITTMSHHILVGMKLHLSQELKLMLYSRDEAEKLWIQHRAALRSLEEDNGLKIEQISPPFDKNEIQVDFLVVHVNNPNSFWVNYCNAQNNRKADDVQDAIAIYAKYAPKNGQVEVGSLCLAPFQGEFYRARVESISGQKTSVFFVDYGNIQEFVISDLILISKESLHSIGDSVMDLIKVPGLALECSLAYCKPNSILSADQWDPQAVEMFKNRLENSKIIAEKIAVTPGPLAPFITVTVFTVKFLVYVLFLK